MFPDMVSRKAVRRPVATGDLPDFAPVPRQSPRHDGWTPARQRAYIEALADTACVAIAARMVNMSPESAYQLRRQPGAEGFRRAWDAAQALGLQVVKDEAFERAMRGQLIPVFVAGKLMGFRRKKNDRLLMFILRHYGQDAGGRKTTVNYFSTRATAGAAAPSGRQPARGGALTSARDAGSGRPTTGEAVSNDVTDSLRDDAFSLAEASTTTVKTVISGPAGAPTQIANDDEAANILNAFAGVELDAEAQAEIYRTLEACAERRRALEDDPENDPRCDFAYPRQARGGAYLGELELGADEDWVEYRPEGEHNWEGLGEGGEAGRIDAVLEEMKRAREQGPGDPATAQPGNTAALPAPEVTPSPDPLGKPLLEPALSPDDPRLDWRNWQDGAYTPPSDSPSPRRGLQSLSGPSGGRTCDGDGRGEGESEGAREGESQADAPLSPRTGKPLRTYKKRQPKPPFTPPDKAREAEAVAEVTAARRAAAAAEAKRRKARARRD